MKSRLVVGGVVLIAGLIGAAISFSGGQAADGNRIEVFTAANIKDILTGAGAKNIKESVVDGDPRLSFVIGETTYTADFFNCEAKTSGCRWLQFHVTFEASATDTIGAVNGYNATYVYGKAALEKDGGLTSSRLVNGTGGSTTEQLSSELGSFLAATDLLLEHMKTAAVTAAAPWHGLPASSEKGGPEFAASRSQRYPIARNRRH